MKGHPRNSHALARIALAMLMVGALSTGLTAAQGKLTVGEEVAFHAASPHPYPGGGGKTPAWSVTVEHPGATYIAIHFDRFELAPGDRVVVRSRTDQQHHVFTGRGKAEMGTFWATHIKGDHAVVELFSPRPGPAAWGVSIDRYAAGFVDLGAGPEAICGSDDKVNAICFADTEPVAYDHSRAVARLLIQGVSLCTGWLVGCEGHLFTNDHCISTAAAAANTDYEFMAEAPDCGSPNCQLCHTGDIWGGAATLIAHDLPRDYSFILLDGNPQDIYGSLLLDDRVPVLGERIYVPQHPGGEAKQLGIDSTDPRDESGFCEIWSVDEPACQFGGPPDVGYFCDTEGGSSGSPVISYDTNQALALHHCADCANRGVPITAVIDHLGAALPACAIMPGPALRYDSHVADDSAGNGDGVTDPGETLLIPVDLVNGGNEGATGVSAILSTAHPGVTITDDDADWPDLPAGAVATSLPPHYTVEVGEGVACGDVIDFALAISADEGAWSDGFSEQVGVNVAPTTTHVSTDTPINIPDNDPGGISSTINVPPGTVIGDINVAVDLTHTWIGDLELLLTSPAGTTVFLHNNSGSSADDIMTTYDSETIPDGPGTMSDYDGEDASGTWTLQVRDLANFDLGTLNTWSLILDAPADFVCDGMGGPDLVLSGPFPGDAGVANSWDVSGATGGGTITYVFGLNAGSTPVPGCPGMTVDIAGPSVLGTAVADAAGDASLSRVVPATASGLTATFQAVELATCTVSNPVTHTFP